MTTNAHLPFMACWRHGLAAGLLALGPGAMSVSAWEMAGLKTITAHARDGQHIE